MKERETLKCNQAGRWAKRVARDCLEITGHSTVIVGGGSLYGLDLVGVWDRRDGIAGEGVMELCVCEV